jgi:carboxyl-terminal processing protease
MLKSALPPTYNRLVARRVKPLPIAAVAVVAAGMVTLASAPPAAARHEPQGPADLIAEVAIQLSASAVSPPDARALVNRGFTKLQESTPCLAWSFGVSELEVRCGKRTLQVQWPPQSARALGNVFRSALTVSDKAQTLEMHTAENVAAVLANAVDDPFTSYLDGEEVHRLNSRVRQEVASVGIQLKPPQPQIIHDVRPGSSAEKQGLFSGDRILSLNGKDTAGMTFADLGAMLIGPRNSKVKLNVQSPGGRPRALVLERDILPESDISVEVLHSGFLYLRVPTFTSGSARQVAEALWDNQSRGVVLDLRQNPGGRIREGRALLEVFFTNGKLGGFEARPGRPSQTFEAVHEPTDVSLPVVVLIDGGSASASEYVSMVMKERGRATILGSTSLGKGSMQNTYPMPGGGQLRVTFGRYVGADGERLPVGGLTPHRFLPRPRSATTLEGGAAARDAWVLAALDILEGEGRYGGSGQRFGPAP